MSLLKISTPRLMTMMSFQLPNFLIWIRKNDLDNEITEEEIMASIKQLKSGKSSGIDDIIDEYLKHSIKLRSFPSLCQII